MTDGHPPAGPTSRWAWVEVDLDAIAHNVSLLRRVVAPSTVWAVVKADGYGHGAPRVARTALAAGAEGLCVALVSEGEVLRDAGIDAPVLVLSQQPATTIPTIVARGLIPTVQDVSWVHHLGRHVSGLAAADPGLAPVVVHVKVDTGMHRAGAAPDEVGALLDAIAGYAPHLAVGGIFTHLATADDPDHPAVVDQTARFDAVLDAVLGPVGGPVRGEPGPSIGAGLGTDALAVHAANSAGALAHPLLHRSFVRAGIAIYGIAPGAGVAHHARELRPALSLHARVSRVRRIPAGSGISYGHRHVTARETTIATLPIGYADGVPRRWSAVGGEVLIGGRRRPIVGVVTMDQLMVDVGDDDVAVGDRVVLLGAQGGEQITAEEWADRLDTIGYEIVCGFGARLPRVERRSIGP